METAADHKRRGGACGGLQRYVAWGRFHVGENAL